MIKKLKMSNLIFSFLIITMTIVGISLSRYETTYAKDTTTRIARWENGLEMVEQDPIILTNGETNSESIQFNIVSNSETTSIYHMNFENVPANIGVVLENDIYKTKCLIEEETVTTTFTIDGSDKKVIFNKNSDGQILEVDGNEITITKEIVAEKLQLTFTNDTNEIAVKVIFENNETTADIIFENYGTCQAGSNQTITHTATFVTPAKELPDISEIKLYATFEQIN